MPVPVPDSDAMTFEAWNDFAHTFDGYAWVGRSTGERTPESLFRHIVVPVRAAWERRGLDEVSVEDIRATLFFQARAARMAGGYGIGSPDEEAFQRALVAELGRRGPTVG
ncbi:hypothetical protein GE115_10195 [Agromyces sp. CFH 90414]|uniref:Uncharacterized protein n=1 Tax=Agromyces agglutinans TaxID=2662258 RepID=A0A6I2F7J0_9MICO|nr:hypothetical protein [Agromyces agglutinans]MRG60234.1 hypothetical protein [Agromyces agglutinans]